MYQSLGRLSAMHLYASGQDLHASSTCSMGGQVELRAAPIPPFRVLMELQGLLDAIAQQPTELQLQAAGALKELPSSRQRRPLPLPCCGTPAASSVGRLAVPAASKQLRRVLRSMGGQPLEWQQQAVEALEELMLGARLQGLPLSLLSVIMQRGARSMRQACRAFAAACRPLQCGLRLSEGRWHYLQCTPASLARLAHATALDMKHMHPEQLQASAILSFTRLQSLTLRNVHLNAEHLSAIALLAASLTALSMPHSEHHVITPSLAALTALRSLTISHPPPVHLPGGNVPPPAPQLNPRALVDALGCLPHLRYLDLALHECEHEWSMNRRRGAREWLPYLADLPLLTHLSLYGWMAEWDKATAALLQLSWPDLQSLSLEVERTYDTSQSLAAAFAGALAARTALTALRLTWLLRSPIALDLSLLGRLRSLELYSWQQHEAPLDALTARPGLTRLVLQAAPLPASLPQLLTAADSLVELSLVAPLGQLGSLLLRIVQLPRLATLQLHLQGGARDTKSEAAEWARCVRLLPKLAQVRTLRLGAFVPSKFHYMDGLNLPMSVVAAAGRLTGLQELQLRGLASHGLASLNLQPLLALRRLSRLVLYGPVKCDGKGLGVLRQLTGLQGLQLGGMPALLDGWLDECLLPLPPRLQSLKLRDVGLSVGAREALRAAAARQQCDLKILTFQLQAMHFQVQR